MKIFVLTSLMLAASVTAAPSFQKRQQKPSPKNLEEIAPPMKAFAVVDEKPITRETAKRQLVRYGPFSLPAAKVCIST
jgi:hypothetical protein